MSGTGRTRGGKTTVITRRIGFLTDGITGSDWLLSVTFTRAAGREMAVRYARLYPGRDLPHWHGAQFVQQDNI